MSEREWRFYLDDMIGFAEKVLLYTEGFDQARFERANFRSSTAMVPTISNTSRTSWPRQMR